MAQDAQALEGFRREARAASALNHPSICTLLSPESGKTELWISDVDGANRLKLHSSTGHMETLVWSMDNSRFVFSELNENQKEGKLCVITSTALVCSNSYRKKFHPPTARRGVRAAVRRLP
jgi:hypothetical protein